MVGQFQETLDIFFSFRSQIVRSHYTLLKPFAGSMCLTQKLQVKYTNFYIPLKGIHVSFFMDEYLYIKRLWKRVLTCAYELFSKNDVHLQGNLFFKYFNCPLKWTAEKANVFVSKLLIISTCAFSVHCFLWNKKCNFENRRNFESLGSVFCGC